MNEMKPEDAMRALDILDKMDFFQGQRAGRELWNDKPFEVQEQDIADFSQGVATVKKVIEDALALLREKDARIEELDMDISHLCSRVDNLRDDIREKDAEIERLKAEIGRLGEQCRVFAIEYPKITRAEAITEFAERCKTFYRHLKGNTASGSVEYYVEQIKKELIGREPQ